MSKKKAKEKLFRIVKDENNPGSYLVQTKDGQVICPAVSRRGEDKWRMRAGNWRLIYMAYVEDATGDEGAQGEFWVKEEYASRVPCW